MAPELLGKAVQAGCREGRCPCRDKPFSMQNIRVAKRYEGGEGRGQIHPRAFAAERCLSIKEPQTPAWSLMAERATENVGDLVRYFEDV